MQAGSLQVADVFRRHGEDYRQQHGASLSTAQRRAMTAIELCRTAALGGHVERCDNCDRFASDQAAKQYLLQRFTAEGFRTVHGTAFIRSVRRYQPYIDQVVGK